MSNLDSMAKSRYMWVFVDIFNVAMENYMLANMAQSDSGWTSQPKLGTTPDFERLYLKKYV